MATGSGEVLRELVGGAYAAAIDDALWEPWNARFVEALGGVGGVLAVVDSTSFSVERLSWHAPTVRPGGLQEYAEHFGAHDPQLPVVAGLRQSAIYLDTDHLRGDDPATARYMAWSRAEFGWDHHMTAVALLDGSSLRAVLSIHRSPTDGHTPPAERRKLDAIFPQVRRALQLGYRHRAKLQDAWWHGVAAREREAAVLIDHAGRILRASPPAEAILAGSDGLSGAAGRLVAVNGGDDALQATLAEARAGLRSGAVPIERAACRPLIVAAYPLPPDAALLGPPSPRALVIIVDPDRAPGESNAAAVAFGFTSRQAALAELLMQGHSIESAAAVLEISSATARIHLRRLLEKTGTTRQSEFVRLLGRVR